MPHDEVFHIRIETFTHPFGTGEPNELEGTGIIVEVHCEPLAELASGHGLHIGDEAFKDYKIFILAQRGDRGEPGTVDIAEGKIVEHVGKGVNTGLGSEDFGPRRAHTLEVCYVVVESHW